MKPGFFRRFAASLAGLVLVVAVFAATQYPKLSPQDTAKLAAPFRFVKMPLSEVADHPPYWAGNHADAIGLNDHKIIDRIGKEDYYSYDLVPFDPKILQKGANAFYIFSNTVQHAAEINWPGPAVLLEFKTKP